MMHRVFGVGTLASGVGLVLIGVALNVVWVEVVGALMAMAGAGIIIWGETYAK